MPNSGLHRLCGERVIFLDGSENAEPFGGWGMVRHDLHPQSFRPKENQRTVAAVDSSTIHIGETGAGSIFGAKAAIAFSLFGRTVGYYKVGPLVVYLEEPGIKQLAHECVTHLDVFKLLLLDASLIQKTLRVRIERTLLEEIASNLYASILMVDGSLSPSPFEAKSRRLQEIVRKALTSESHVHGVSKTCGLKILRSFSDCLRNIGPPAYIDVHNIVTDTGRRTYGRVLLVRFSRDSIPLRVDVACPDSEDVRTSIAEVAYSDGFYHGYHESLRLAHYLSAFSFDEIASVKGYLLRNLSAKEAKGIDSREFLLGPRYRG